MYVKPAPGRVVVDPARMKGRREEAFLPAEGRHVADSDYWIRRIRDGDVVKCEPPAPSPESGAAPVTPSNPEA